MKRLLTSLRFLFCLLLELLKLLLILSLNLELHLGQLDLILILGASDLILQHRAVVAPLKQFEVVYYSLFSHGVVCIDVLRHFRDCYLTILQLDSGLLPELIDSALHVFNRLIGDFLIFLLEVKQLVPQEKQLAHLRSVFLGEVLNDFLFLFDLFFELFN